MTLREAMLIHHFGIDYPPSVHFFGTELETVPLTRDGQLLAHVYGISYGAASVSENLALRFPPNPEGPFSIAMLHTNVGARAEHEGYSPCSLGDLEARAFDYWALGHVHKRETLRATPPVVHYPGNTQGLHMKDVGPRGATLVDVSTSGSITLSPVWTDAVRWHRGRSSIDRYESIDDVITAFDEISSRTAAEAPDRFHIMLWTLMGSGKVHDSLRRADTVAGLLQSLRERHAPEPAPGAIWLQRLDVATRPMRDIEELRKQQDLLGDLLRLAEEARENPPAMSPSEIGEDLILEDPPEVSTAIRDELGTLLDDPRLRAVLGGDAWDVLDWQSLLRRAEVLAVEGLLGDDTES